MGTTWEARVKLNCLTDGAWPAFWLLNDDPVRGAEIDIFDNPRSTAKKYPGSLFRLTFPPPVHEDDDAN